MDCPFLLGDVKERKEVLLLRREVKKGTNLFARDHREIGVFVYRRVGGKTGGRKSRTCLE